MMTDGGPSRCQVNYAAIVRTITPPASWRCSVNWPVLRLKYADLIGVLERLGLDIWTIYGIIRIAQLQP